MLKAYAASAKGVTGGSSTTSTDFNYSQTGPQYTPNGYPVVVSRGRSGGYSYYMNGVQINSRSRMTMKQVDDYFTKRDQTDLRYR